MPIVNAVVTAAKLTSATYRIVATTVMGYYLVKGVVDYEKQRRKESKRDALNAYSEATGGRSESRRVRGSPPEVAVARRVLHPNTKFAFVDEGSKK